MTDVLVCVKRVPETSGQVVLTADGQSVDARHVGYTVSAHEECAVALAVEIASDTGGTATVLTVGSEDAAEQLRDAVAVGCQAAIRVDADADRLGPVDVATAIASVVRSRADEGTAYDLVLLGNDAADTGDFQVAVRLAYLLGRPVVTGIDTVQVADGVATARGEGPAGTEVFALPLPAVVAVQEGGIEPKYPSIPGRMRAKRTTIETEPFTAEPVGSGRVRLTVPPEQPSSVTILGEGPDAAVAIVDVLEQIGVVSR